MGFGFPPKYSQDFSLDGLDKKHFLLMSIEAASALNWDLSQVNDKGFKASSKFSLSSWNEEITLKINHDTANIKSECAGSQFIDWGKNKKNVHRLLSTIAALDIHFTPEDMEAQLTELKKRYPCKKDENCSKRLKPQKENNTGFFSIFIPRKGYFLSPILMNINILVFIAMSLSGVHILMPENQSLLDWGANLRPLVLEGEWWRLFTACFIHIGILHLLLNMYALFYIGFLLEPYLGTIRFLAAYLISGIAASMTSLWWHDFTISAGASGAIFGMYVVFLALLTTNLLEKSVRKTLLISIFVFVGYNILNGLAPNTEIDNAAHIGGLLTGLIIGYAFVPSLKHLNNLVVKYLTIGILTAILFVFSLSISKKLPNDIVAYYEQIQDFVSMESMALEVYNLPKDTPNEKILSELKDRGLYYWKESSKLIESFKDLNLPANIQSRNIKLKEYCDLRIKSYELIYKAIQENTDQYEQEISDYNQKIEVVLTEINGMQ